MGTIITGGFLLEGDLVVRENFGLAVDGKVILETDSNEALIRKYPGFGVMDCSDQIISPGFVNAHMHLYGVLAHGISVPGGISNFKSFLEDFWWPYVEDRIDLQMIEVTSGAMALELADSGVTAFCDVLEAPRTVSGALETAARAVDGTGIRAVLSFEASERAGYERGIQALEENSSFINRYLSHSRISGMNCIHTTFTCSDDFIRKTVEEGLRNGAPVQMHLSESSFEPEVCMQSRGELPVHLYERLGLFDIPVLAAQGVKLTDTELNVLSKNRVDVVHVPMSNCEVGGGFAPVPKMLSMGINVALGTDGYINNFFEVMRSAFLIHKANLEDPEVMPAETVYRMATINGSSALSLPGGGFLKKGAPADFITIRPDIPTPVNSGNIFDQLILGCNPVDVKNVFADGKIIKKNGVLQTGNLNEEYGRVRKEAERLWEREI